MTECPKFIVLEKQAEIEATKQEIASLVADSKLDGLSVVGLRALEEKAHSLAEMLNAHEILLKAFRETEGKVDVKYGTDDATVDFDWSGHRWVRGTSGLPPSNAWFEKFTPYRCCKCGISFRFYDEAEVSMEHTMETIGVPIICVFVNGN